MLQANEKAGRDARPRCGVRGMMTGAIGRLLRCAALVAVAGLAAGCASPQGAPSMTAPAGYGKDAAGRVERLVQYCARLTDKGALVAALGICARAHELDPAAPEPPSTGGGILPGADRRGGGGAHP